MKYLKDFEPLHKNVLAQESWAQISLIMKKQGQKCHETASLSCIKTFFNLLYWRKYFSMRIKAKMG